MAKIGPVPDNSHTTTLPPHYAERILSISTCWMHGCADAKAVHSTDCLECQADRSTSATIFCTLIKYKEVQSVQLSQHSFHCHRKTLLLQLYTFADVFQTLFFFCVVESCACYTCECDGCDAQKHAALASHLSLFLPENCSQYYFMVCFLFNRLSISSSCKSNRSIAHARSQCRIYPMRAPPPRHSVPLITRTTACNWLKAT